MQEQGKGYAGNQLTRTPHPWQGRRGISEQHWRLNENQMLTTRIYRYESQPGIHTDVLFPSLSHTGCHCPPQVVPQQMGSQKVNRSSSTQVKPGQPQSARHQTGLCTYLPVAQVLDLLMHKLSPGSDLPTPKAEPSCLPKLNPEAIISGNHLFLVSSKTEAFLRRVITHS